MQEEITLTISVYAFWSPSSVVSDNFTERPTRTRAHKKIQETEREREREKKKCRLKYVASPPLTKCKIMTTQTPHQDSVLLVIQNYSSSYIFVTFL